MTAPTEGTITVSASRSEEWLAATLPLVLVAAGFWLGWVVRSDPKIDAGYEVGKKDGYRACLSEQDDDRPAVSESNPSLKMKQRSKP